MAILHDVEHLVIYAMSEAIYSRIALILGATGSVGAAAVQALHADGWRIRALHRNPAAAGKHPLLAGAIERELPAFAVFHFGGHWLEAGGEMVDAIRSAVGKPGLPMRGVPWPLLYAAAPFSSFLRELIEMRYLWMKPLRLDNRKLVATLGSEPHTPLDEAVKATLRSFQCIPAQAE